MLKKTDKNAKWELQMKWDDDATIEMRYFETYAQAERYADSVGCENYDINPNK